ncbi:MAG: MFS transporter [Betaproteobacteria bacterium]|nr:MFS transporter [Betaproteobacteria bacterium]
MTGGHPESAGEPGSPSIWLPLLLLWLSGIALRLTILAVPPVIPMIRSDFALSATEVGILGSVAPALFAVAALGGALLVARIGVRGALVGGLVIVAAGAALRGLAFNFPLLLAASIAMSAGVAIMQPVMPTTVRHWMPLSHVALGTAIYTNGLLVGEVIPVLLMLPVVLPLTGGSWRIALALWAIPIALIALFVHLRAPRFPDPFLAMKGKTRRWMPDWHRGLVWRLGVLFCCVNAIYFATNAFIPIYLTHQGRPDLISATLTALNFGQIPASLLLLAVARRLERRMWPYLLSGLLSLASIAGLVFAVGPATPLFAGLLGFSDAAALILGLTLPALLCAPEDVARTSAGVFTLSYGAAVIVAVVSGALWDATGIARLSFAPIGACAIALAAIALVLRGQRELR